MHFLGKNSHAYVEEISPGNYIVGDILTQIYQEVDLDDIQELGDEVPVIFDFLTPDEYEQLKMYFV